MRAHLDKMKERWSSFTHTIYECWSSLTNTMSKISTGVCITSLASVSLGQIFWLQMHDPILTLGFFGISLVLMPIYAAVYGFYAMGQKEFNGGFVSARRAMCFITLITTIAFLYHGVELQMPDLRYTVSDKVVAMLAGPVMTLVFAVTYFLYVHLVEVDLRWRATVSPRGGPGHFTIGLLNILTEAALLYCAVRNGHDGWAVLRYIIAEISALVGCTAISQWFKTWVPPLLDRGLKPDCGVKE